VAESLNQKKYYDISIALAGIFQVASLVRSITRGDQIDWQAYHTSINSIYRLTAPKASAVFIKPLDLQLGLEQILCVFKKGYAKPDPEVSRYALAIIHLENKLKPDSDTENLLKRRLTQTIEQNQLHTIDEDQQIKELADIYLNTLGTLDFRIQITSKSSHIRGDETMQKIRALLLAGIRATVLWRQVGGKRWQLFLARKPILNVCEMILNDSTVPDSEAI